MLPADIPLAVQVGNADAALRSLRARVADEVGGLSDDLVASLQVSIAELRVVLDSASAAAAGELAHRSRAELGHSGLAQREGFRSPQAYVQHLTGGTGRDAIALVEVGRALREASAPEIAPQRPWLVDVGALVAEGALSIEHARSIARGLGEPRVDENGRGVDETTLAHAARELIREAAGVNADEMFARARQLRDQLDVLGIAEREARLREQRSASFRRLSSGATQLTVTSDLETGALLEDMVNKVLAPRRSRVRFVDEQAQEHADEVRNDPRTDAQYLHDAVTDLLRLGATADTAVSRKIVGSARPSVRVHVTAEALQSGDGAGYIEGSDIPVSLATVERIACSDGLIPIVFDDQGQALNLGRDQRTFTGRQRLVLAARDGGCRVDGCCVPAALAEAHHCEEYARGGKTDVENGILLCKFHHLLLHNNGWRILRKNGEFWLVPPAEVDPQQQPRPMPTKNGAQRDLQRRHRKKQASAARNESAPSDRVPVNARI
jgi:hypothetical protein